MELVLNLATNHIKFRSNNSSRAKALSTVWAEALLQALIITIQPDMI